MITYIVKENEAYGLLLTKRELTYLRRLVGADTINPQFYHDIRRLLEEGLATEDMYGTLVNSVVNETKPLSVIRSNRV